MKEIYIYNAKSNEIEILERIAKEMDTHVRYGDFDDLDQKVGFLLKLDGFEKQESQDVPFEKYDFPFILFNNFENEEIFDFIDMMRDENLFIAHKASTTLNNLGWTLRVLLDENDNEHRTMKLISEINDLVQFAHDHKESNGENEDVKNLVEEINSYFKNPEEFEIEKALVYKNQLEDLVKGLE